MRLILAFLTLVVPVLATSTEEVTVDCPVCGNKFTAEAWMSTNNIGGQDRDFCKHAAGGQVFIISCWTCPRCCYTGYADDFDPEKAPKELIEKLKKENPLKPAEPIDAKSSDSRKVPPWVRYDLRIQVLKLDPDTKAKHLANVCLRAAQTQRFDWDWDAIGAFGDRMNDLYEAKWQAIPKEKREGPDSYDLHLTIARALESDAADEKSLLDTARRIDARLAAAILFKERGEDADARRVLSSLAGAELSPDLKAVAEEIRARCERERKYRLLAIPYFEKHLAEGKPEAREAVSIRYLLGVLCQRTGDPKKALTFLEPLLEEKGIPEGFMEWIKDEIAKAKAG